MPTIDEVFDNARARPPASLPALQRSVLEYLATHPNEVFSYEDVEELAEKMGDASGEEVRWGLWVLDGNGLVAKTTLGRKVYFGSRIAINHLLMASHLSAR